MTADTTFVGVRGDATKSPPRIERLRTWCSQLFDELHARG